MLVGQTLTNIMLGLSLCKHGHCARLASVFAQGHRSLGDVLPVLEVSALCALWVLCL